MQCPQGGDCAMFFDRDLECFKEKFGDFESFEVTANPFSVSTADTCLATIILYKRLNGELIEVGRTESLNSGLGSPSSNYKVQMSR